MSPAWKYLWLTLPPATMLVAWGASTGVVLGALLAAIAVSFAGWTARGRLHPHLQRRPHRYGERLQVLQSLYLSREHAVHAVRFDASVLLIGTSDGAIRLLHPTPGGRSEAIPLHAEREGTTGADGVDLRDTPRAVDDVPMPRNLAGAKPMNRSALTDANLADFREKLAAVRQSGA